MTDEMMSLRGVIEKALDADLLREMIGFAAQRLMELEVGELTGAAYGEKSADERGVQGEQQAHRRSAPAIPQIRPKPGTEWVGLAEGALRSPIRGIHGLTRVPDAPNRRILAMQPRPSGEFRFTSPSASTIGFRSASSRTTAPISRC